MFLSLIHRESRCPRRSTGEPIAARENPNGAPEKPSQLAKTQRSSGEAIAARENPNETSERLSRLAIAILAGRKAFRGSRKPKRSSGKPFANRES